MAGIAPAAGDDHAPLRARRLAAVLDEVRRLRPWTVVDLGCGEGPLLGPLLDDPRIAHVLDPADLRTAEATVFGHAAPDHAVLTTPNYDYNVLYPELDGLRHRDHRFELTRAGFTTWAERICAEHGYVVDFHDVGDAHPDVGPPTQMAGRDHH